jgi:hypothetical protein
MVGGTFRDGHGEKMGGMRGSCGACFGIVVRVLMILCIVTTEQAEIDGESRCGRMSHANAKKLTQSIDPVSSLASATGELVEGTDDESPVVDRFCRICTGRFNRVLASQYPRWLQNGALQYVLHG